MSRKASPKVIGAFVVGGIAIGIALVVLMGSVRLFRDTSEFVVHFKQSVNGLKVGAPVKLRGIEIGQVKGASFSVGGGRQDPSNFRIPVIIEIDNDRVREEGGRTGGDTTAMRELINNGLRASLSVESFVTGVLYVSLDFKPGSPAYFSNVGGEPYFEIPTTDSDFEAVQSNVTAIVEKLAQADVPGLIDSAAAMAGALTRAADAFRTTDVVKSTQASLAEVNVTLKELREFLAQTESRLVSTSGQMDSTAQRLRATLDQASATLEALQLSMGPDAPAVIRMEEAMAELAAASRAFRELAQELERNPSGIVRGRAVQEKRKP
jgi:paraquat-inducible protein B